MNTLAPTNRYKNHRFPVEIISHGVWLYYRFCLSYRDVEELLFVRACSCPMKPFANGVVNLANNMPISSVAAVPGQVTSGIWTRCF